MKKSYKIEVDCANCANKMEGRDQKNSRSERCHRQLYDS